MRFHRLILGAHFVLQANSLVDASSEKLCNGMADCQAMSAGSLLQTGQLVVQEKLIERAQRNVTSPLVLQQQRREVLGIIRQARKDGVAMQMVSEGIQAVIKAVAKFTQKPPHIHDGIKGLGEDLLKVFEPLLKKVLNDEEYGKLEADWHTFLGTMPEALAKIEENIQQYIDEGTTKTLVWAIVDILEMINDVVLIGLEAASGDIALEVSLYMDAVEEVVNAVGDTWADFEKGVLVSSVKAAETLYQATRSAVDKLLPENITADETYVIVTDALDEVMASLSNHVYKYRDAIMTGSVCYRTTKKNTNSAQANVCPQDYDFTTKNGKAACTPKEGASVDTSTGQKVDGATAAKSFGKGSVWAECNLATQFVHYKSHYCYGPCAEEGWTAMRDMCKIVCTGNFSHGTDVMCGKSSTSVDQWVTNSVMAGVVALWTVIESIIHMTNDGVTVPLMSKSINALATFGQSFARPDCDDVM